MLLLILITNQFTNINIALIGVTTLSTVFVYCYTPHMLLPSILFPPFRNPASSPTKLLCFTRSSSLIQQLPSQYPSSVLDVEAAKDVQQTLHDLVFPDPSQLVVFKSSSLLSQRSIQKLLKGFVQCDKDQVSFQCLEECSFMYMRVIPRLSLIL